jgi:hypothetical protein
MAMFEAAYAGTCSACEEPIRPGDRVLYVRDELVHAGCADGAPVARVKKEEVCTECWLIKPCDCEEF